MLLCQTRPEPFVPRPRGSQALGTRLHGTVEVENRLKGPVIRYNFSCNLQRNSTLKRCKFVTNVWYVKNILANCDKNLYLPILHLPKVELSNV